MLITVNLLVLETNGVVQQSVTVTTAEVKSVEDDVDLMNGSTIDPSVVLETDVIVEDVNGHLDKFTGEDGEIVKSTEEVQDANGIANRGRLLIPYIHAVSGGEHLDVVIGAAMAGGKVTPKVKSLLLKYQHMEDFRAIIFVVIFIALVSR